MVLHCKYTVGKSMVDKTVAFPCYEIDKVVMKVSVKEKTLFNRAQNFYDSIKFTSSLFKLAESLSCEVSLLLLDGSSLLQSFAVGVALVSSIGLPSSVAVC